MRTSSKFGGVFVPVITPFSESGKIYERGMNSLIEYLNSCGIKGLWLLGSYGAFPLLSEDERMQTAMVGLSKAKDLGMTIIVNVSSPYTDMAVRLAKHAQANGAHAVASVVPFYYAASHYRDSNFFSYFQAIIRSVEVPVIFYNNERATGFKPDITFFKKMFDLGIHGLKSKGDYIEMAGQINLMKKHSESAVYLSGSTSVHLQGHLLGANGVTSGVAIALPKLVISLQKALEKKDIEKALRLQDLVLTARNIMGRYIGRAVACYDILDYKGIDAGTCRSPWLRMEWSQAQEIIQELQAIEDVI